MELYYKGSGKISYSEKEYECDLYLNKDEGGILLNIISKSRETGTFFKFPLEIPFLIGELSSGLKNSLFLILNEKVFINIFQRDIQSLASMQIIFFMELLTVNQMNKHFIRYDLLYPILLIGEVCQSMN